MHKNFPENIKLANGKGKLIRLKIKKENSRRCLWVGIKGPELMRCECVTTNRMGCIALHCTSHAMPPKKSWVFEGQNKQFGFVTWVPALYLSI